MKLIKRTGYYLIGFSIGLVILAFIWKAKRADFSYMPDARVLKNISTKQLVYTENAIETLRNTRIDTSTISDILKHGNVNLSKVDRKLDSCKIYIIEGVFNTKDISVSVMNCETTATINSISFE
jgi:hypothetical protein